MKFSYIFSVERQRGWRNLVGFGALIDFSLSSSRREKPFIHFFSFHQVKIQPNLQAHRLFYWFENETSDAVTTSASFFINHGKRAGSWSSLAVLFDEKRTLRMLCSTTYQRQIIYHRTENIVMIDSLRNWYSFITVQMIFLCAAVRRRKKRSGDERSWITQTSRTCSFHGIRT